jgi:glycosyltransferase involved in cell wall biosynthesis
VKGPTGAPGALVRRPRVVHLTTVHDPRDTRIQKQCRTLAEAGYDVTLVATADRPVEDSAVPVRTLPRPRSRLARMLKTTRQARRIAGELRADVYHFHDPELMPVGSSLRRRGARVVYDVHEDYPAEIRTKEWIAAPLRPAVARVTDAVERRLAAGRFDLFVAATPPIARRFPASRTVLVQNFPAVAELTAPAGNPYAERANVLAYVGDVTTVRGASEMVAAVGRVDAALDVHLKIAGRVSTPGLAEDLATIDGFDRTELLGHLARSEVRDLLSTARAGLVLFHPTPNHLASQPNKLFEYMAAGIPVLASDFPLWREIVEGAQCGLLVDPQDPTAIAAAVERILRDPAAAESMGRHGRHAVETTYNWDAEGRRLVEAYAALLR